MNKNEQVDNFTEKGKCKRIATTQEKAKPANITCKSNRKKGNSTLI